MLAHNPTGKYDQLLIYAFRLLNYITIERGMLTMVHALHKFINFYWKTNLSFM